MIPGNLSSQPAYNVVMPAIGNVVYYCLIDGEGNLTKVRGQIVVSAIPQALERSKHRQLIASAVSRASSMAPSPPRA